MAGLDALNEAAVRDLATPQSWSRGCDSFHSGEVVALSRHGDELHAAVQGSDHEPYQVRVHLRDGRIAETDCTCPYEWGGACKHVVAALLAALARPGEIEQRPPLAEQLDALDRDQLQALVLGLADREPALAPRIEAQVARVQAAPRPTADATACPAPPPPPVDTALVRRGVRDAVRGPRRYRSSEACWMVGSVASDVLALAERARPWIERGDGRAALAILEAVTEEYADHWEELDDADGEASRVFSELTPLWIEALLSADLDRDEREDWADQLAGWAARLADHGIDDAFYPAEQAALQGWEEPGLAAVLRGEADAAERARRRAAAAAARQLAAAEPDAEDLAERGGGADWYVEVEDADLLTVGRLNVLERQGRFEEYLRLSAVEGQHLHHAAMLVRMGRTDEAVAYARTAFQTASQALALAEALAAAGAADAARQVADHGLTLRRPVAALARWLRDQARAADDVVVALRAVCAGWAEQPTLADFQAAEALAGERWPPLRDDLLAALRAGPRAHTSDAIAVYLREGLHDDAIRAVERGYPWSGDVARVADAVLDSHPDWVMGVAWRHAEEIIERGKADHYAEAADWLERARTAARVADREGEWHAYLDALLAEHRRKHKLLRLLEPLRT